MTRRDMAWRLGGLALFASASGIGLLNGPVAGDAPGSLDLLMGLLGFLLAITGIVFLVQGKRVPNAWRAERRRHRTRTSAIAPARQRRIAAQSGRVRSRP